MRYLNHAGTSWPKPPSVLAAVHHAEQAGPDAWPELFAQAHTTVAAAFGVSVETLLPTPGCTQALAVAIADLPWSAGDRIVTTGMEHHALVRPLAKLAERGVEVVEIGRGDGPVDLDAVASTLAAGGVRLVAASMASNVTGEGLPYADLIRLAHAHGALCLLDGAQVAGWMSLDLERLGVDLFAFAGHKGPQGPTGIGGLYVRPEGGRTRPSYCATGSVNLPALCGLAAGLSWMAQARPHQHALSCNAVFRDAVSTLDGVTVLGGSPAVPTSSVVVRGRLPIEVAADLRTHGIVVRGGTHCAPRAHATLGTGESGTVRVSFGPTSTHEDARAAAEALDPTPA